MTVNNSWQLESVFIRDLLGFQGEAAFQFTPGLQVLEAPNHTGKSSLALALLWGLTGEIPKLSRIDQRSFRLTNKHAGANAEPSVKISLLSSGGSRMEIRRKYLSSRDRSGALEVSLPDLELSGEEASDRILAELGTKPATLEGCGVVLQDHRLKLVTGSEADISEVINDMLGLQVLSEVVPCLQQLAGEGDQLRKEVDEFLSGADPVARWSAEDRRLRDQYKALENAAIGAGIASTQIEDPTRTAFTELIAVSQELAIDAPAVDASIRKEVGNLRAVLSLRRKESGESKQLSEFGKRRSDMDNVAKALRSHMAKWDQHDKLILEEQLKGETDQKALAAQMADADQLLAATKERLAAVENEKTLLAVAYEHVLGETALRECPVCEGPVKLVELRKRLKERLDVALAGEMEELSERKKQASGQRTAAGKRLEALQALYADHERLYRTLSELRDDAAAVGTVVPTLPTSPKLLKDSVSRRSLVATLLKATVSLEAEADRIRAQEAQVQQKLAEREDQFFQPLDDRINRVQDVVVPLVESVQQMERHAARLESVTQREAGLRGLVAEAQELASRLKKLAKSVSEDQEESAREAVNLRLPFVSDFFSKVACNPDYTGLSIETTVSRDKVAYRIRATSSKMAALTDSVGHVLSEGDLSAAGMALLLGLASGDSHHLGLLVLDDPGQGMDPQLQKNFARELAALEHKPQVIVLTHQPEFAAALEAQGCERRKMGRWEGGRLFESS